MILHPSFVLPVLPGETPVGYASRVALRIGCSLQAFCNRINVPLQELLDGVPRAVASLREVCALSDNAFADTTYVRSLSGRFELADETFSIDQVNREALRICPVCVEQQLAAGRDVHEICSPREWHLTPLYVCDVHAVPIVTIDEADLRRYRQDFAGMLNAAVAHGRLHRANIENVPESGLGHHIRRRLRGVDDGHWLSRMPMYAAIKTADLIGVAALHGVRQAWQDLDVAERFEAGRVGHEILGEGDVGLRNLFTQLQQTHSGETSKAELLLTFGRIHVSMLSWRDTAFDPLRDVLRQHLVETMAFGSGDVLYGKEITERRIHSGRTAAPELGLSPATARKRLRHIGVLAEPTENPTWDQTFFDARTHADDMRRLSGALQRADAIRYLGLEAVHGGFSPILDMIGSMNVDKTSLINQIFAKEDLDAFLASLLTRASTAPPEAGFEPILKAARRLRTSLVDALDLIRKGEIADIRISPEHEGILSLMVRKQDLYAALVANRPWITMVAGAKAIKMREPTLSALVNAKIIPSKGAMPMMLKLADLEAFTRTYVSRWEVARQYRALRSRQNRFSIIRAIAMAGLKQAFDEKNVLIQFYRREEVIAAFGPPPA